MYSLTVRPNRMYFALALAFGLIAVVTFPPRYLEQVVEIPLAALYLGELGFALMATLLFYDRATPGQVVKVASWMLGLSMFVGAVGNLIDRSTQFMSDYFVLMNLAQLVIMNLAGLIAVLSLFQLEDPGALLHTQATKPKPDQPAHQPHVQAATIAEDSNALSRLIDSEDNLLSEAVVLAVPGTTGDFGPGESAKEILEQLDVSRITRLERSLHPEEVSLEMLFGEESHAAQLAKLPGEIGGPTLLESATNNVIALPGPEEILRLEMRPQESCLPKENSSQAAIPAPHNLTKTMRRIPIANQELSASTFSTDFDPQVFKSIEEEDPELKIIKELAAKVRQSGSHSQLLKPTFKSLLAGEPMDSPLSTVMEGAVADSPETITEGTNQDNEQEPQNPDLVFETNVDEAVEHVFQKLVPTAAQLEVSPETLAKLRTHEQEQSAYDQDYTPQNLTAQQPKEIKEFGRLSQDISASSSTDSSIATMKSIGRLLLDTQAIENIIRVGRSDQPGLTTARIVSLSHGTKLHQLLENINSLPGVTECLLVGFDGLVIASAVSDESEKESLGALALSINGSTDVAGEKLELGKMQQIILQSPETITVLTNVAEGVLLVLGTRQHLVSVSALIEAIEGTIALELPERASLEDKLEGAQSIRSPVAADLVRELINSLAEETPESAVISDNMPLEVEPTSKPKEVKEFGRLSAKTSSYLELKNQDTGSMKTIGKLLIDPQAIANIIKAGETGPRGLTTARVISAARGEGIRSLLQQIDRYPGVAGSLIVGHDGLVIASTLTANLDKDLLGAMSIAIHSNTALTTKKVESGNLCQTILQSQDKVTILTEVEVGVLAVFLEAKEPEKLNGLLQAIYSTIHG